jgi:hypothetical protein
MPNNPKPAKEKRDEPRKRQNAQDDHEGGAHHPDEFSVMKPASPKPDGSAAGPASRPGERSGNKGR